jgi:hypothetical protein
MTNGTPQYSRTARRVANTIPGRGRCEASRPFWISHAPTDWWLGNLLLAAGTGAWITLGTWRHTPESVSVLVIPVQA